LGGPVGIFTGDTFAREMEGSIKRVNGKAKFDFGAQSQWRRWKSSRTMKLDRHGEGMTLSESQSSDYKSGIEGRTFARKETETGLPEK